MGFGASFAKTRLGVYLRQKTRYRDRSLKNKDLMGFRANLWEFRGLKTAGNFYPRVWFCGGVAEWLKALAWKAGKRIKLFREFESHPLRHLYHFIIIFQ